MTEPLMQGPRAAVRRWADRCWGWLRTRHPSSLLVGLLLLGMGAATVWEQVARNQQNSCFKHAQDQASTRRGDANSADWAAMDQLIADIIASATDRSIDVLASLQTFQETRKADDKVRDNNQIATAGSDC